MWLISWAIRESSVNMQLIVARFIELPTPHLAMSKDASMLLLNLCLDIHLSRF